MPFPAVKMCKSLTVSLALLLLSVNPGAHAKDLLGPFVASYSLHSMGTRFADMRRSFTRLQNGEYVYRSETHTVGLLALFRKDKVIEKSTGKFTAGRLQPLRYSYQRTGGKKDRKVIVNFDWSDRRIINSVNGSTWHMPIQAYIMDKLLYQLAIMYDLQRGKKKIDYAIADGGKIKQYDFERIGEDRLDTPIGKFDTLKLIRHKPNSKRRTVIWCARELGYMPVKVENVEKSGRKTTAIIETLSGVPSGKPAAD